MLQLFVLDIRFVVFFIMCFPLKTKGSKGVSKSAVILKNVYLFTGFYDFYDYSAVE